MHKQPKILRDFLVYLTAIKGKSKRTREEYEYDLTLFIKFQYTTQNDLPLDALEQQPLNFADAQFFKDVTLEDLYLFLEYCEEVRHNSAKSRARKVATLKSFFKYLKIKKQLIDYNPADELETPKTSKRQPVYLTIDEAQVFLAGIDETNKHYERDYCMMILLLNLGLRVSELCALNVSSIENGQVKVIGKGDKQRTLFLNQTCIQVIQRYIANERTLYANSDAEALFLSQKGTRLTRQRIAKIVRAINEQSGLQKAKLSPHKLRHTSATLMYKSGADIRSLQQILGHSNVSTTQIYTHIEDEVLQKTLENHPLNNF